MDTEFSLESIQAMVHVLIRPTVSGKAIVSSQGVRSEKPIIRL